MQRLTHTFDRHLPWKLLLLLPFIMFGNIIILPPTQAAPIKSLKHKQKPKATPIVQSSPQKSTPENPDAQTPQPNPQGLVIQADTQEANSKSEVVTARGNVRLNYPSRKVRASANLAEYYIKQKRILLTGNVVINQDGNTLEGESITYLVEEGKFIANPKAKQQVRSNYILPDQGGKGLIIQSNTQEANTKAEIVTARGNVRLSYPEKKLQARANLATYNIKDKQIVLSGNVLVVNNGSSLQGDTITYLIEEGRFVAKQKPGMPVQSIYVVPEKTSKQ
jgi:lipopolysaccharide export system protein LptA